jgi:membrane protease YdiL (CAAX protease family)
MLVKLICDKDTSLLPKKVFGGYLLLTLLFVFSCFAGFFVSNKPAFNFLANGASLIFLILFLFEDQKKLSAYGLLGGKWKTSFLLLGLFLLLYLSFSCIFVALTTNAIVAGDTLFEMSKNFLPVLLSFPLSSILFFGEEYGWRCYFQPLLQKNFGLIKGVFLFGVLWGLWHFSLDLFFYPLAYSHLEAPFGIIMHQVVCISLGIFMAYVYMKTHNVWLPAMIHCCYNGLATSFFFELNYTWGIVGLSALLYFVFFWPFLFSKVFRKPKADCDSVVAEKYVAIGKEDK